jgi:hypothetical protein
MSSGHIWNRKGDQVGYIEACAAFDCSGKKRWLVDGRKAHRSYTPVRA